MIGWQSGRVPNVTAVPARRDIGIIGGGLLGLVLAYRFAQSGQSVTLYERDSSVGGLIRSIRVNGLDVDRFYHVILTGDRHWLALIRELGLEERVYFTGTQAGFFHEGKTYSLSTIGDFLRFPLLAFVDRLRLAWTLQWCRMQRDWHPLEKVSIHDFLTKHGGKKLFEKFWKPLLNAKFDGEYATIPMTYIWSRVRRMASTRKKLTQREEMGHIKGNLQGVVDTLQKAIESAGGRIVCNAAVEGIIVEGGTTRGIAINGTIHRHDAIVSTIPNPQLQRLLPAELRRAPGGTVEFMGIVSILLVMKKQLTPFHTLSLMDGMTPYTAIIETTNVIPPSLMHGRHLVYIPKYLSPRNRAWLARTDDDLKTECFNHLRRMFAHFDVKNVEAVWIGRESFVEPLYTLDFHRNIPSIDGPVDGLFVANNSQTYPFLLNCESVIALAASVVAHIEERLVPGA
jgi:protoporphyrinogen oxidase